MQYQEHDKRLSQRMGLLDISADKQLARELFELHEKKCTLCQEDRLSCSVRPACRERNFLNLLIELGVGVEDLPSFCYSVYLDQVRRFILERKGRGMDNRRIPIKDLLSTLKMGSIRQFTTRFSEVWKKTSKAEEHDLLLLMGDDLIFHFDFARGLVLMNPFSYGIADLGTFKLYVSLFSAYYGVTSELESITSNWWAVRIRARSASSAEITKRLDKTLLESFADVSVENTESGTHIQAEVIVEVGSPAVEVADLKHIFVVCSTEPTQRRSE